MRKRKPAGGKAQPAMLGGLRAWPAHARAWLVALCLLPAPAGAAPFAYIPNTDDDSVLIVDTATNLGVALVPVGDAPQAVAVAPATGRVYVANHDSASVSVIDSASDTVVATVPVADYPIGVAVNPAGTRVYVTHGEGDALTVIDAASHQVTQVTLGQAYYMGVAVNPAGTRVYVAAYDRVWVIDTASNLPVAQVTTGIQGAAGITVSPDGGRVYVSNLEASHITVIDGGTNAWLGQWVVDSAPGAVAVIPDGTKLYVADYNSSVVRVIDTGIPPSLGGMTFPVFFPTVAVGNTPTGVSVTPDGTRVYVTNADSNNYSVIDTAIDTVIATEPAGAFPSAFGQFIMAAAEVPPVLAEVPDQSGTVGTAFSLALSPYVIATNGDAITGYAVASGALPPGLTLNGTSGVISGTPGAAGIFNVTVTASDDDGASNAEAIVFTIAPGAQAITGFAATPASGMVGAGAALSASGGASGNPVVFASASPAVCTVSGSTVSFVTPGNCSVTADQAGNGDYHAAPQVSLDIPVAPEPVGIKSYTAPSPTGSGNVTASFSGGGTPCGYTVSRYLAQGEIPAAPPAGVSFPHGLFEFTATSCTAGATLSFTVTYSQPLPTGTQYWKHGPTPDDSTPHWYVLPATIDGNTVTFSITDGGLGDDDLTADGSVTDAGGPGAPAAAAGPVSIPTLSEWAMIVLAMLIAASAARQAHGRRRQG